MLGHRDGVRLVAGYAPASARVLRLVEEGLRVMHAQGVPLAAAAYAGDTLMSYVTGFVLQEQTMPDEPDAAAQLADFPLLSEWNATKPSTKDAAFAAGLDHIVTGIRARLFPASTP
jgi:TetR/AcrR family tetracycline transcriptional repressor